MVFGIVSSGDLGRYVKPSWNANYVVTDCAFLEML